MMAIAVAFGATAAHAAPSKPDAKAAFDQGVAAYTKDDFEGAREALARSFSIEPDIETLFAWAQTERKLERCDRAIELYEKLVTYDMPDENKAAVRAKLEECRQIVAASAAVTPPALTPVTPPTPTPTPTPTTTSPTPEPASPMAPEPEGRRAWWKDPVGGALVGTGVVGVVVGGSLLISARGADRDKESAPTYGEFQRLEDKATSRGRLGVLATIAGTGLIASGVVWYVTRNRTERRKLTGWIAPDGGGVVAHGRF